MINESSNSSIENVSSEHPARKLKVCELLHQVTPTFLRIPSESGHYIQNTYSHDDDDIKLKAKNLKLKKTLN